MSFLKKLDEKLKELVKKSERWKNKKIEKYNIKLIKIFVNHLNIIVSKMAREENLSSKTDIGNRPTEIFEDAMRIQPETEKGKLARTEAQKYIIKLSGEHIHKMTNEEMELIRNHEIFGFSEDKKKKL